LFGSHIAVQDLNLAVAEGEFLVLVGPSGCGKTTTLRMLAGLEQPSFGAIEIRGRAVNRVPPRDRNIALVFQSYALYPHMTVRQNLGFGLRCRRVRRSETRERVAAIADTLELAPLLDRRPSQLSGGQRQRVALGRALIRDPEVFLMDEPLSNLDASLRLQMRGELARLHRQLGATIVYVTHDQTEAMTMGSRIAIMRDGVLQQVDSPQRVYDHPANAFVAGFVGSPKMNLVPGRLVSVDGEMALDWVGGLLPLSGPISAAARQSSSPEVTVGIRSEDLLPLAHSTGEATIRSRVEVVEPLGSETLVTVCAERDVRLVARLGPRVSVSVDEHVHLSYSHDHLHLFDAVTGENLRLL
jgi:multiple sugar transport system ATP-binding protein